MAVLLKVRSEGRYWVPDHPELAGKYATSAGPYETMSEMDARRALYDVIESDFPGVYEVESELDAARSAKCMEVDLRSDALIAAGFEYKGVRFSASLEAQIRMTNMMMFAPQFPYPYVVSSLDDKDAGVLVDADDMRAWCQTALSHVATVVGVGTALKEKIRKELFTLEEVLGFVDPRPAP